MRHVISFASCFVLLLFSSPSFAVAACVPAANVNCLGQPCDGLGKTMMDGDQTNLIACLRATPNGSTVWKAFTSGTPTGTTTPQVTQYYCPYGNTNNNTCAATCNHQAGGPSVTCVTWYMKSTPSGMVGVCGAVTCMNTQ